MRVLSPCLCYASYSHTNTTTPHPFPTRRSSDLHPLVLDGDRLVALLELDDVGQGLATGLVAAEDLDVGVHGLLQVAADVGDAVLGRGTVAQTLQQLDGRILHARGQLRHLDHLGVLRGGDAGAAAEDVDVQ